MEDNVKKPLMIGIAVICIAVVGVMMFKGREPAADSTSRFKGKIVWVKCVNEECEAEYEMDKQDYFITSKKYIDTTIGPGLQPIPCEQCNEESVYLAVKCEKCGLVFFGGAAGVMKKGDTCPDCGFSLREQKMKEAAERAAEYRK